MPQRFDVNGLSPRNREFSVNEDNCPRDCELSNHVFRRNWFRADELQYTSRNSDFRPRRGDHARALLDACLAGAGLQDRRTCLTMAFPSADRRF